MSTFPKCGKEAANYTKIKLPKAEPKTMGRLLF